MLDGSDLVPRLDAIDARLDEHARRAPPAGWTDPDPDDEERWQAPHVWAHMAEFVTYWREQMESVVAEYDGDPVPFGRVKTDAGRIAAIELGRREPIPLLADRVRNGLAEVRRYVRGLTVAELSAIGRHPRKGDMDIEAIAEDFIARHLEEHLDQLDRLAAAEPGPAGG